MLLNQVRSSGSRRFDVIHTYVIATARRRQKRRIGSRIPNPDPQNFHQRKMPAKMRKQWIHQTMEEATPRPTRTDETSGTEEEHIDIDHGNFVILSSFYARTHSVLTRLGHHASTACTLTPQAEEGKENINFHLSYLRLFTVYALR